MSQTQKIVAGKLVAMADDMHASKKFIGVSNTCFYGYRVSKYSHVVRQEGIVKRKKLPTQHIARTSSRRARCHLLE